MLWRCRELDARFGPSADRFYPRPFLLKNVHQVVGSVLPSPVRLDGTGLGKDMGNPQGVLGTSHHEGRGLTCGGRWDRQDHRSVNVLGSSCEYRWAFCCWTLCDSCLSPLGRLFSLLYHLRIKENPGGDDITCRRLSRLRERVV